MAARVILFDLDGTVWDSRPWYAHIISECQGCGRTGVFSSLSAGKPPTTVAQNLGLGRSRLLRACKEKISLLRLYPGVESTLVSLVRRKTVLGVVTSMAHDFVDLKLHLLGLQGYFATVVDASHGRPYKPSPEPINRALRAIRASAGSDIYYVGDTPADATATIAAGLCFAWAAYGYSDRCPDGTSTVIRRFSDVLLL